MQLELSVSDLGVQQVHTGRVDLDQDLVLPQFRVGISPTRTRAVLP